MLAPSLLALALGLFSPALDERTLAVPVGLDLGVTVTDGVDPVIGVDVGFDFLTPGAWFGVVAGTAYDFRFEAPIGAVCMTAGLWGVGIEAGVVSDFDDNGLRFRVLSPSPLLGLYMGVEDLREVRLLAGLVARFPFEVE